MPPPRPACLCDHQSDMRLLKLYESGLPAWAIILPSYGLPYHPWMRRATWLLFVMLSFFSMACGFYVSVPTEAPVGLAACFVYLPAYLSDC